MRLCTVKKTGKRYVYSGEHRDVVVCKGEVERISGLSAAHGLDKRFKRDAVWVQDADLTEQLLRELAEQNPDYRFPPPEPIPSEEPAWVEWEIDWRGKRFARLTPYADKQLMEMGLDMGRDGIGNYLDENTLQDAAVDSAMYIDELTREGVREGLLTPCREAAADMIYEGMLKALKEKRAEGKKTTLEDG